MVKSDTKKYSLDELRETRDRGETETRADAPELKLDADFWQGAHVVMPPGKSSIHLRIDTDRLEWFKAQGHGHLSRMNALLRSFMEAQKQHIGHADTDQSRASREARRADGRDYSASGRRRDHPDRQLLRFGG